jgi:hypothetical protein
MLDIQVLSFVISSKFIDPWVLEFMVSNTTSNTQWGNCISLDFNFRSNLPFMYISTDPPEVNVITVTSHFRKNRLDCLAQGVPTSYTYSRWEHKSMFGEHIRYLDGFDNGTLLL